MKNKLILLAAVFLSGQLSFAGHVSLQDARTVTLNFLSGKLLRNTGKVTGAGIAITYSIPSEEQPDYYIFNLEDNGFVAVSAEDAVIPVLAYSFDSRYDPANPPPQFLAWMKQYQGQIEYARLHRLAQTDRAKKGWERYLLADPATMKPETGQREVLPLVCTKWNQDLYYNEYCPATGGPGGHAYAGCVPAAMGQIMYYYRWPDHGVGSYTDQDPQFGPLTANFDTTWYAWSNMCISATRSNPGIAGLLYHVGVACDLVYGAGGSGMFNHKAAYALRTFFKYSPQCQYVFRDSTQLKWDSIIMAHLDRKMPLYYAGWSVPNIDGHAFVCDGYQDSTYFHFNWGWGGSADGYFYLDNLTPSGGNFNLAQELIINFFPDTLNYTYPKDCAGQTVLHTLDGSLEDGSGIFNGYSSNSNCEWLIDPQSSRDSVSSITLNFGRFSTNPNDHVDVYDGPTVTSPLIRTFSGNSLPDPVTSTGNKMLVTFNSTGLTTGEGWSASYYSTQPDFCHGLTTITADTAELSDGSGPFNYSNKATCRWIIDPQDQNGRPLTVYFKSFDTEPGKDILTIHDYMDDNTSNYLATISGHYSHDTLPDSVTSPSGKMYIIFISDVYQTGKGWELYYPARKPNSVIVRQALGDFTVFPVPADDEVVVSYSLGKEAETILQIISDDGRILCSSTNHDRAGKTTHVLNISSVPPGVNIIRLITGEKTISKKLIKR